MASYRYWRTVFNSAGQQMVYRALQFLDTLGGTDLTGSGSAIASGRFDDRFFPVNGFDRDSSTMWLVNNPNDDQWLGYDFGTPVEVLAIGLEAFDDRPAKFATVQGSTDGTTWITMSYPRVLSQTPNATTFYTVEAAPVPAPLYRTIGSFDLRAPGALSGYASGGELVTLRSGGRDDGGPGSIAGEVDITGTPPRPTGGKEVRLHNRRSGALIAKVFPGPDGAYRFDGLSLSSTYYVVAFDPAVNYNAVIADNIAPVVIP